MQTKAQLNVAIVGAGLMGRWHAHAAKKLGANIVAVVDSRQQTAEGLASRVGGNAYNRMEDALEKANFDVVHICTPLDTHFILAKQILTAKKHLIIEKPLASSSTEVAELQALATSQDCLLCPVHQFAFQRGVLRVKKELNRRANSPLAVAFDFASAGGIGHRENALNQILIEILPHPLSILSEIWPESVLESDSWFVDNPRAGELFAYGRHHDIPVSIKLSLHARPTHCKMTIYHAQGAIHLNLFHGFAVFESSETSRINKIMSPFTLALKTIYAATDNLFRRIFYREPAYPGLRTLIGQCYESIENATPGPLSHDHNFAVSEVCEKFSHKLAS